MIASAESDPAAAAGTGRQPSDIRGPRATYTLNPALMGFTCIKCETAFDIGDYFEGCPACLNRGEPSSLSPLLREPDRLSDRLARGMSRYAAWMPYSSWPSLGEGGTPCISFPALAKDVNAAAVYIKNEGQNPTGSHKDRVSCLAVARAVDIGAPGVVAASSGNGGASLALYAAAAGIECCVVTTPTMSPHHQRAITMTGARLLTMAESLGRWRAVADMTEKDGWFPVTNYIDPPVGSNHFGLPGLRTVAYEIFEELGDCAIDAVLVPTSRGDLIWGLYQGFDQLRDLGLIRSIPRLYAVEPFPRLTKVLEGAAVTSSFPGKTDLVSIGGSTATYQALVALRRSGGGAVVVEDTAVAKDQSRLARHGYYAELSTASALTGLDVLLSDGRVRSTDQIVLVGTSHGYKDPTAGRKTG